ncbi:hypothetical protein FACS189420_4590 [Bacteroidia bacterium]|nr:hypothetical protein FACS189420_4590 [Bacteroidia bacterium]
MHRSVKELVSNAIENIFCLDNKILVTLKYLLFFPGKLSVEFSKGRVVSYVHPAKLFWFITILFFALVTSHINWTNEEEEAKEAIETVKKDMASEKKETFNEKEVTVEENEEIADEDDELFDKIIERIAAKGSKSDKAAKQEIINNAKTAAPFAAFLLIPIFAFQLFIFFHKQKKMFVDHFVFALHVHSFVFLWYAILLLINKIQNIPHFYSSGWLILFVPLLYIGIATYVFYRPKIKSLIWKVLVMNFIYFIGLFITILILLLVFVAIWAYFYDI